MKILFQMKLPFIIWLVSLQLANQSVRAEGNSLSTSDWQKLEAKLLEAGYENLFSVCQASVLDEIWNNGKNQGDLEQIIMESGADPAAKFLAANFLMDHDWKPDSKEMQEEVAMAFATALQATKDPKGPFLGLIGNAWGLPIEEGEMGKLSERLIGMGDIVIPFLRKCLDDYQMLPYEGSEVPTVAYMNTVRVRDIATRITVRIKGYIWEWHRSPKVRDSSIGFMRDHLGF